MTGFALDILDLFLAGMDVPIAHGFGASMAVNTIQRIFAFGKLRNWLIIIMQAVVRLVVTRHKGHCAQIVIPAVVTGVALRVRNGSCKRMDVLLYP